MDESVLVATPHRSSKDDDRHQCINITSGRHVHILGDQEDEEQEQSAVHSPQGYQGEQKHSNPISNTRRDASSHVSSYIPHDYVQLKEIENYLLATSLQGAKV